MLPLAIGTLGLGLTVVVIIVVLTAIGIVRARGNKNSTFLEWDPIDRTAWRREVDDADVVHMLAEHNQRRAERGLDPQTMEEYVEQLRRR
ncbi:hypothetical protein DSM112329_04539 [Paraconexibacter sp. AEG42_29]|uniref:Uncharacterized protein n=1 Tax=Paraconexibacter sp. AEG42_29 TaxID=2997339 RepID=A0AAU7B1C4_9ACTN